MQSLRALAAAHRPAAAVVAAVLVLVLGAVVYVLTRPGPAPSVAGVAVCGRPSLNGPPSQPPGSVLVPAGDDHDQLAVGAVHQLPAGRTYYFAPGVHTIGTKRSSQIEAGSHDTFVGAPGAVLDGQGIDDFAIVGNPAVPTTDVTIEYLTIEHFHPPGQNGAVGSSSAGGWTFAHDTIEQNYPGAGAIVGTDSTLTGDCLTDNGQYGFQATSRFDRSALTGGPMNVVVTGNEISDNNRCDWGHVSWFPITPPAACDYPMPGSGQGCGCSGGAKFWKVEGATVKDNYVHDNYGTGLWADTDDDGFVVEDNVLDHNLGEAVIYEVSYNLLLEDNDFYDNAWGSGPRHRDDPVPAVYISESGGNASVPNPAGISTITISGNRFVDNWAGVVLWEDADRFCGSTADPTDGCTLADPSVANKTTCDKADLSRPDSAGTPDYFALCRWRTQDVRVLDNTFVLNPSVVPSCEGAANSCGVNGVFANSGSEPKWSPYKGDIVAKAITTEQGNVFDDNTYTGPWSFDYFAPKTDLTASEWRRDGEDVHSTFHP